jgi:hypothetical protein
MMVFFVDSSTNMNDERVFLVDQTGGGGGGCWGGKKNLKFFFPYLSLGFYDFVCEFFPDI